MYIFSVFELAICKNKALYIGKEKDNKRNVYNEYFIVSQEPQRKKRKN